MVLLRHGDAGQRRLWVGDDRIRPLSPDGGRQADALVDELVPAQPRRILTSDYLRCRQTVEPLAAKLGLPVETADWLRVDAADRADAAEVIGAALRALASDGGQGGPTVLCTHGEVMALALRVAVPHALLADLLASGAPTPPGDKGARWELVWDGPQVVSARYQPAPPSPAPDPERPASPEPR